nr:unnamed protein product [Callosobruchus analis]
MRAGIFGTTIIGNTDCTIIGPVFYHNNLTTERYLHLLQNDLENTLVNLNVAQIRDCWMQQDGAPAHNLQPVREYLSMKFPEKVISTYSETSWPARSADITPLDFFLWGFIKNYVYHQSFHTEEESRRSDIEAVTNVTPEILTRVLESTIRRCYLCLENEGNLFEHML